MKHSDYFFLCILLLAHPIRVNPLHFTSWFPIQYLLAASSKSYLNISVESETEEVVSVKPTRREIRLKEQPLKNSLIRNKVFKLASESTSAKLVSHFDKEPAKKRKKLSSIKVSPPGEVHANNNITVTNLLRSFVHSLFDPTVGGKIKFQKPRKKKSKKHRRGFEGLDVPINSGMTFGPVCGPNGCF